MPKRTKRDAAEKAEKEPDMVITTVALDKDTHSRVRHLAIDLGKSFRDIIREAVDAYLVKHEGGRR